MQPESWKVSHLWHSPAFSETSARARLKRLQGLKMSTIMKNFLSSERNRISAIPTAFYCGAHQVTQTCNYSIQQKLVQTEVRNRIRVTPSRQGPDPDLGGLRVSHDSGVGESESNSFDPRVRVKPIRTCCVTACVSLPPALQAHCRSPHPCSSNAHLPPGSHPPPWRRQPTTPRRPVSLDSTSIKVHPDGTGALKKTMGL